MKERIAKWYKQGLWTADMVRSAVNKGIITEADYAEIVADEKSEG